MTLQFDWVHKSDGFDPTPSTPWLMVPKDGFKEIKLAGFNGSLWEFTWSCTPSGLSWAPAGGERLLVFGPKTGRYRFKVSNKAGEVAELDVSVKARHTYKIRTFTLIHDGGLAAKRSFGSLELLVKEANDVLTPQTNQRFTLEPAVHPLVLSDDFGSVVSDTEHDKVVAEVLRVTKNAGVIPLVIVRKLNINDAPGEDTDAVEHLGTIVIEDAVGKKAFVLAHELGHYFGVDHNSKTYGLMYAHNPRGTKVYKAEANTMNTTGVF